VEQKYAPDGLEAEIVVPLTETGSRPKSLPARTA
jgi:hypothetical protein